ncbi:MAG TPA: enoyl-CoA hydratase [Nevskiaceae bacterium]|nr:enoyl-CoA hydratase [Nevskiaceae bacterium]
MSAPLPLTTHSADGLFEIRFNRPDKKNALTAAMYTAGAEAIAAAEADPLVRAVLIAGTEDCFTAGNDMADFLMNPPQTQDSPVSHFMRALAAMQKPLVAAVNGPAIGIGTTLLLHSDLVYAGAGTRFQLPFVAIGICPEFGSSLMMPAIMGHVRAAELLLLGEPFSAAKAAEVGLVNEVLPDAEVLGRARAQARKFVALPPNAVRQAKALLKRWTRPQVEDAIRIEGEAFMAMLKQPEALEALTAFAQKRKPDFSRFR